MRDLHAIGLKRFERGDHLFEMIDVLPVHDQVHGEGDAVPANQLRQFEFVRMHASAGDPVRRTFFGILKAELNVIEAGVHQLLKALARQADAGGDEIRVELCIARAGNHLREIGARQWLASSEVKMQNAKSGSFAEDAQPVGCGQFFIARRHLQRIRAIHAVQRAAMRDLGDEG